MEREENKGSLVSHRAGTKCCISIPVLLWARCAGDGQYACDYGVTAIL